MPKRDSQHWENRYQKNETPWDVGVASRDLIEWLQQQQTDAQRMLDIGCGTGINLIAMARQGHHATGIDFAPKAIELAMARIFDAGYQDRIALHCVDALTWECGQPFDFILDRGCYHCNRESETQVIQYIDQLKRLLKPTGVLMLLTGNSDDPQQGGPPKLSLQQLRDDLEPHFDLQKLEPTHFEEPDGSDGPLAWLVIASLKPSHQ